MKPGNQYIMYIGAKSCNVMLRDEDTLVYQARGFPRALIFYLFANNVYYTIFTVFI